MDPHGTGSVRSIFIFTATTLAFLLALTSWEAALKHRPITGLLAGDLGETSSGKHKL